MNTILKVVEVKKIQGMKEIDSIINSNVLQNYINLTYKNIKLVTGDIAEIDLEHFKNHIIELVSILLDKILIKKEINTNEFLETLLAKENKKNEKF